MSTRLQIIRRAERHERTAVEFRHDLELWWRMHAPKPEKLSGYRCNITARRQNLTGLIDEILLNP